MAKVSNPKLKVIQNRNRVNFCRKWKSILKNENKSISFGHQSRNSNLHDSNHERRSDEKFIASSERLRHWAIKYNISKCAVSDLLKILISLGMSWLPKDSRTLLSTPRYIEMKSLTNGKLWYVFCILFRYTVSINKSK